MKAREVLLPAIAGTTAMTLFSYLVSELAKENFSEPEHLGTLINRLLSQNSEKTNRIAGWGIHYSVGLLFAAIYKKLWEKEKMKPSLQNGFVIGGISGAAAILIWKLTFKLHPAPPWINYKNYYIQLFDAHIIFALTATLTYRLLINTKNTRGLNNYIKTPEYNSKSL